MKIGRRPFFQSKPIWCVELAFRLRLTQNISKCVEAIRFMTFFRGQHTANAHSLTRSTFFFCFCSVCGINDENIELQGSPKQKMAGFCCTNCFKQFEMPNEQMNSNSMRATETNCHFAFKFSVFLIFWIR